MWPFKLNVSLSLLTLFVAVVRSGHASKLRHRHQSHSLRQRDYITEDNLADAYDFVIVGGGLSGLVLASRLSENPDATVLVLEAGDSGDAVADRINTPSGAYYSSLLYTPYDWQYKTVPQPNATQRIFDWPRGKVLGGSSAVNAMYLVRPSKVEINAWRRLMEASGEPAEAWGWDSFYEAMKKSETFIPPGNDVAQVGNISWNTLAYGSEGPMQASYPGIMMSQAGSWVASLDILGLPPLTEANSGKTLGSLNGPSWINPSNWTRSYSKSAYLDPVLSRPNLKVLVNATVTQIVLEARNSGDQMATAVQFATSQDIPAKVVRVNHEVILSAGVVGSPQLLMLSGVGPRDVLDEVGIPQKIDLPGVGQHLQDHLTAPVVWASNSETAGDIAQSNSDFSRSREFLSFVNSATAWVNLTRLFGTEGAASFQGWISDSLQEHATSLVPSQYREVTEGYKAIYDTIANTIMTTDVAILELLLATNTPGQVGVQAAIQHPLSQGRLYINSSSVFDPPVIDPHYFTHPADLTIMREGIKLVRALKQTPPFNNSLGDETFPGPTISSDEDLETWLINQASTQYHPIASCAMLPRSQGGVVNAKLQVYGLANVRVVDSSVYPFEFASHVGASTYGLAEQASTMILADFNNPTSNSAHHLSIPTLRLVIAMIFCFVISMTVLN